MYNMLGVRYYNNTVCVLGRCYLLGAGVLALSVLVWQYHSMYQPIKGSTHSSIYATITHNTSIKIISRNERGCRDGNIMHYSRETYRDTYVCIQL